MQSSEAVQTQFLQRPGGRIAYDVRGEGSLVLMVPGMGDPRSTFRFQVGPLAEAGFRVATMDLRGHGESDRRSQRSEEVEIASSI